MENQQNQRGTLITAGILIGMGAAGFFDGIVFHQILQWHHLLTSVQPANMETNTLWDGLFHAGVYLLTAAGIVFLWRAGTNRDVSWSLQTFIGSLLVGAGSFNLIEGIINHHILGIHHVKAGPNQLTYDLAFLIAGAILAAVGWILLRREATPQAK